MKINRPVLGVACVALLTQAGCLNQAGAPESKTAKLVFITSGTNLFWQEASAGMEAAARDFNAEFEVVSSSSSAPGDEDWDGIAFTPINGAAQLVASGGRICFVGVDHYKAGRKAGALVKEAAPSGCKIVIFSQTPDFVLAQERHRGIADELPEARFVIMDVNSKSALLQHLDAAVVIALSGRDVAVCAETLCARDRLDQVKLFGFEDGATTRELLAAGHVYSVVAAEAYQYGYHAVRVLAGLTRGDMSVLPRSGFLDLPLVVMGRETASHTAEPDLHWLYDSTLFPRADAGNLDRATQAGNLAADRTAGSGSVVR